jgi:hypothetical protein
VRLGSSWAGGRCQPLLRSDAVTTNGVVGRDPDGIRVLCARTARSPISATAVVSTVLVAEL